MLKKTVLKDKQVVSDFLKISLRTLNRYIKKYDFSVYTQNNVKQVNVIEVFFKINNNDLGQVETVLDSFGQFESDYVNKKVEKCLIKGVGTVVQGLGQVGTFIDLTSENKDKIALEKKDLHTGYDLSLSSLQNQAKEVEIYKNLYKETINDLKLKQERLEGATYRVGQLEAQIKNSVPLLTYRQKEEEVIQLNEVKKREEAKQKSKIEVLEKEKQEDRIVKNLYVVTLFSLLILTPILLIYILNK